VVVIPLAGDDVPAELTPTTPVAKVNTTQGDYMIMNTTVIDTTTQLEWQRQDDDTTRNWDDAWQYCVDLELDGHHGDCPALKNCNPLWITVKPARQQ